MFSDEGVTYNCFRGKCDATCALVVGEYVSKKFKALMKTMGISVPVEILMAAKKKGNLQALLEDESHLYKKHSYKEIELPDGFVPFDECNKPYKKRIGEYYENRCCPLDDVFIAETGKYQGLSGFGMYQYDKLIGMNIVTDDGKYLSHFGGNSHVMYIPSRTLTNPVIVVEGGLDAKCFPNTVATLSHKISPEQAFFLRGKDVIMLPDRKGGNSFIDQFSAYGWSICIPDWDVKDLNDAVKRYGKLVTARKIVEGSTKNLLEAKTRYKLWSLDGKESK